jgi:hypothetical protein
LWRHLGQRWLAGKTANSKQLLLDIVLGVARLAIIDLASRTRVENAGLSPLALTWD